mgnify:CR=1 FL=1
MGEKIWNLVIEPDLSPWVGSVGGTLGRRTAWEGGWREVGQYVCIPYTKRLNYHHLSAGYGNQLRENQPGSHGLGP